MRVVPYLSVAALCLGLSGCALFHKKPPAPAPTNPDPLLPPPDRTNTGRPTEVRPAAPEANPVIPTSAGSGVLAGQVIDSYSRPLPESYILVTCPKQGSEKETKIDVPANDQGYFTITGLKPGRHYQLTARARDNKRMLAGITWATAPNPRVLIRISEDFVTRATPPIPPPPVWPGSKEKTATAQADTPRSDGKEIEKTTASADDGWGPARGKGRDSRANGGDPTQAGSNPVPTIPIEATPPSTERIAEENTPPDRKGSPLILVPWGPQRTPAPPKPALRPAPSPVARASRVPSCVLIGKQLVNFALYDLDNRVWEFRQRSGQLVLLDFWGTWCPHCVYAIPHLKILQDQYRSAGLQVIGIAYERTGTQAEKRRRVDDFCQLKRINYKVLMGGANCPVQGDFHISVFPTLVLLDQNGWIVWHHEGGLDEEDLKDLEMRIRLKLGVR